MNQKRIIAGITHGDINGIGYEIIMKTLAEPHMFDMCTPVIYGSPKVAAYHRKALDMNNFNFNNINDVKEANARKANILNCADDNIRVELGKSTQEAGNASVKALRMAVSDMKAGKVDVLVTAPFCKYSMQSAGFSFPGHTEFLQAEFNCDEVLMMMVSHALRIAVVTGHIPLSQVTPSITQDTVYHKLSILNDSLEVDFNIQKPRIAVLSLNPHAGENGMLGNEEETIIKPALERARKEGIFATGPFPSDGFFYTGMFTKFDGILSMYHDQGLTAFKALTPEGGVNFTAGMPVVRTSPAHGTGYDIVGKNTASAESFRDAMYLACDIFNNRCTYDESHKNKVKSYDHNKI